MAADFVPLDSRVLFGFNIISWFTCISRSATQSESQGHAYSHTQKTLLQSVTEWKVEPEMMEEDIYKTGLPQALILR